MGFKKRLLKLNLLFLTIVSMALVWFVSNDRLLQVNAKAPAFTWNVNLGNKDITSGGYYKSDGTNLTTTGASSSDYNVYWDATSDTLYLNNLNFTSTYSNWPNAGFYFYESSKTEGDLRIQRNVKISVKGSNSFSTTNSFGFHVGRYGGLNNLEFFGDGNLEVKSSFSTAYVNGNTIFSGSGQYTFSATNGSGDRDVGMQCKSLIIKDSVNVKMEGVNYGVYVGLRLEVDSAASLIASATSPTGSALLANVSMSGFNGKIAKFSSNKGTSWQDGVIRSKAIPLDYNEVKEGYVVINEAGEIQTFCKLSDIRVLRDNMFTVSYNLNDGTNNLIYDYNVYEANDNCFIMYDHVLQNNEKVFLGWSTNLTASTPEYVLNTNEIIIINSNVILYAVYDNSSMNAGQVILMIVGILISLLLLTMGLYILWKYEKAFRSDKWKKIFNYIDVIAVNVCKLFYKKAALFTVLGVKSQQKENVNFEIKK